MSFNVVRVHLSCSPIRIQSKGEVLRGFRVNVSRYENVASEIPLETHQLLFPTWVSVRTMMYRCYALAWQSVMYSCFNDDLSVPPKLHRSRMFLGTRCSLVELEVQDERDPFSRVLDHVRKHCRASWKDQAK